MRPRDWFVDARLALGMVAVSLFATGAAGENQAGRAPVDAAALGLAAVAAGALLLRRRWPLVTLAVAAAATSLYLLRGYPYGPILVSFAIAVYTVAALLPTRRAVLASGLALLVILLHSVVGPVDLVGILPGSAWVVVPFAVGVTVRLSRESAARSREERVRDQAYEERLRVAQEVHDVVGHGLAAINMQAEIALHVLPKRPEQAEAALTAISRTSREALDELRATLAIVRRSDTAAPRTPGPGLAQLDGLVARLTGTGVPVRVEVTGEPRELPAAVDLAAYRVVQESLTNVLRHAGTASATVLVGYQPGALIVEVIDTGRGGVAEPADGAGHGIAGMRARVTALGGRLSAGPAPAGGFRVYAELPLNGDVA